ncbi:MAG: sulfatase-like hydrolase/transferase, partial [Anaerohalosphaera sp.]|nr:sulfatase-like hydrolase/transferase [Anaerohalosphaera sp.]
MRLVSYLTARLRTSKNSKAIEALRPLWTWLMQQRLERIALFIGLACTLFGKIFIIYRQSPSEVTAPFAHVIFPDLVFFTLTTLIINFLYAINPSKTTARFALAIGLIVFFWSILNTGWLIRSGVQIQPGVLKVLFRDPREIWPLVLAHLFANLGRFVVLLLMLVAIIAGCGWSMLNPGRIIVDRIYHMRRVILMVGAAFVLMFVSPILKANTDIGFTGEVLGYSSHWQALCSTVSDIRQPEGVFTRNIPIAGQRTITAPDSTTDARPNVVIIMLESVSYAATSLADDGPDTTPNLSRLAKKGVQFKRTIAPVSHTTKALWSTLTGTTSVIEGDYVEAIPVEKPYESLATILARSGYKSAFFEMSKGSFECGPGLFNNLGFNWAWFRENLEDPSANLGYMSGDDCKAITPAFQWAMSDDAPFMLVFMSTVAHDPFEVPPSFAKPAQDDYQRYLQTVRYTDYFVGRICDKLDQENFSDNTIVCVLGDHGTSFRGQSNNGRWVPYDEVIRVPWVLSYGDKLTGRNCVDLTCSQVDV